MKPERRREMYWNINGAIEIVFLVIGAAIALYVYGVL